MWCVCDCRSFCVFVTDKSFTSPGMSHRVSWITSTPWKVLFPSHTFPEEAVTPVSSPLSDYSVILATSRLEDPFFDMTANSTHALTKLSIEVKIAFCIFFLTVSIRLPICLLILPLKHLSNISTFTTFSLVVGIPSPFLRVNFRSTEPLFTATLCCPLFATSPKITFCSNSSNWLRAFCFAVFSLNLKP